MQLEAWLKKKRMTQTAFGLLFDPPLTQGLIWQWLEWLKNPSHPKATKITGERALEIQQKTKGQVSRRDIRPDLFGSPRPRKLRAAASESVIADSP